MQVTIGDVYVNCSKGQDKRWTCPWRLKEEYLEWVSGCWEEQQPMRVQDTKWGETRGRARQCSSNICSAEQHWSYLWTQLVSLCGMRQHFNTSMKVAHTTWTNSFFHPSSLLESRKQPTLSSCFLQTSISDEKQLMTSRNLCSYLMCGITSFPVSLQAWQSMVW